MEVVDQSRFIRLVELREQRDFDKAQFERSEREYREYEKELFSEVDESPLEGTIKMDLGPEHGTVSFRLNRTVYGRIIDQDTALEAFEDEAITEELTKPGIQKRRLNELVRERLENGVKLPEGIDYYENRGITISRKR